MTEKNYEDQRAEGRTKANQFFAFTFSNFLLALVDQG